MNNFYRRMKMLEAQGIPRQNIIDGRIFKVPNLDFPRLLNEGVAYGILKDINRIGYSIYPEIFKFEENISMLSLGIKSYITAAKIYGTGFISVGNYSGISEEITFELGMNNNHHYENISSYELGLFDFRIPADFWKNRNREFCKINIGSDVWIGIGCILKNTNPARPLIIGDGAVIASDSVVVKNVPPYAIVGGNPARLIKYRFSEDIIEALLRIKWWNWDIDKIYENFKYFNRVEEFVALHDKGA